MSYILDALRRADAERERGRVPGLHAQALPLRTADTDPAPPASRQPRGSRPLVVTALLVLLALLSAFAWWGLGGTGAPGADASPPVQSSAPNPAPDVAPPANTPANPPARPDAPATPATPATPAMPAPLAAIPRDATATVAPPILAPAPPPAAAARPAAQARQPQTQDDEALPRVADLAPTARAGLPPLQISGTTYAESPALRMLIIDGKVLQEGQDIAPGLRLEAIGPRSAVLNHQGRRLRLTY